MNEKIFEKARQYALKRLETELPTDLFYHGVSHTVNDVVPAAERFADLEGVGGGSLLLLLTAAWFHDLGFVEQSALHEMISARIALEVLPELGYADEEVETVRWAILATALPQSPRSHLEEILVDADLDVLGREDFFSRNNALRRELAARGRTQSDLEWFKSQLHFLESHNYFTAAARKVRDEQKRLNAAHLKAKIAELEDHRTN